MWSLDIKPPDTRQSNFIAGFIDGLSVARMLKTTIDLNQLSPIDCRVKVLPNTHFIPTLKQNDRLKTL
ncbi:hypothetical protein GCM10026915_37360 [Simiduia litorea]